MPATVTTRTAAALCAAAALVFARPEGAEAYLALKGGFFIPNEAAAGLADAENGLAGEFAIGGSAGALALEAAAGLYHVTPEQPGGRSHTIVPLTATAKYRIQPGHTMGIFAGVGVGYYLALGERGPAAGGGGEAGQDGLEADEPRRTWGGVGYHAVAGVEVPIAAARVVVETRWSLAEVRPPEGPGELGVGGITVLAGVKF